MTITVSDRIKETSVTSGSGSVTLLGAFGGFQSFSNGIGDGNTTYYAIENDVRWEVGIGVYTSSSNTVSRDTVLASSNGNSLITLDGVSIVFCTPPASKMVLLDDNGDLNLSGVPVALPSSMSLENVTVSGSFTHIPYDSQGILFIRETSGNYFQAYVDDANDRTLALYTDATSSPQWRLGMKGSPSYIDSPPTYAFVCAEDGDMSLHADSTNIVQISNSAGFEVTHKSNKIFAASSVTGVHINQDLYLSGSGQFTGVTHHLGGIMFADGTTQITSPAIGIVANTVSGVDGDIAVSGWVVAQGYLTVDSDTTYTGGSGLSLVGDTFHWTESGIPIANSGYFQTLIDSLPVSTNYSVDILANTVSGVAGDIAVSGWVVAQGYGAGGTSYTAGSGMELVGTVFNWTQSGIPIANSGYAEQVYLKTHPNISSASSVDNTGRTYIQDVTLDSNGHIIGLVSATETVVNIDTTYTAGSGMTLQNNVFHYTDTNTHGVDILANSSSGVAISGWASNTFLTSELNYPSYGTSGVLQISDGSNNFIGSRIRDSGGSISILDGAVAQSVDIFKTHTSTTDNEYLRLSSDGTNHTIESLAGSAGGTVRQLHIESTAGIYIDGFAGGLWLKYNTTNRLLMGGAGVGTYATIYPTADSSYDLGQSAKYFRKSYIDNGLFSNDLDASGTLTADGSGIFNSGIRVASGIYLPDSVPVSTTNELYNDGGSLKWNGSVIDSNTTYTAGSGMELVGTQFHMSAVGGSGRLEGLIVDKAIKTIINTEPDLTTITYNMNDSNRHMSTLRGNRTVAVVNAASGQAFMIRLKQDGVGSRTVTWFTDIKWAGGAAPTLSTAANHTDWLGFICTSGGYYDGAVVMSGIR